MTNAKPRSKLKKQKEDWEGGWSKWFEQAKKNKDKRAKEAKEPGWDDGFRLGFMGAVLTRSETNIAPPIATIQQLANEQLDKQNVEDSSHAGFVRGFKVGWGFGWTSDKK